MRHSHAAATDFLDTIERSESLRLEWIGPERFHAAAGLFYRHAGEEWSFADGVSFVVVWKSRNGEDFTLRITIFK